LQPLARQPNLPGNLFKESHVLHRIAPVLISAVLLASPVSLTADQGAGAYLAALVATRDGAFEAGAKYYAEALAQSPNDAVLAQGAMVTRVAIGDVAGAVDFARQLTVLNPSDEFGNALVATGAMATRDFDAAVIALSGEGLVNNPLLNHLLGGWALIGAGQFAAGIERFGELDQNNGLRGVARYHQALANAYAGDFESAARSYQDGGDATYISRTSILAHAEILAVLEDYQGATLLMTRGAGARLNDAEANDLRRSVQAGAPISFTRIQDASDGAAEALMLMAEALRNDDAGRLALFFARLSAYLQPNRADAAVLIGDILVSEDQGPLALAAYRQVPVDAPLALAALAGAVGVMESQGGADAAIDDLLAGVERHGEVPSLLNLLGDVLRRSARYGEAVDAYSRAIDAVGNPDAANVWSLYYMRGIALERDARWDEAEIDLRKAMQLSPDQAGLLNMLGYSLVDRGLALDEALEMIERAMELRPDDGYITDSLAWALYRMGRYEEALPHMLQAVLLRPGDGILNDHYGDILWKVGRQREAVFQWNRALASGAADIDRVRIEDKLASGLDAVLADEADAEN